MKKAAISVLVLAVIIFCQLMGVSHFPALAQTFSFKRDLYYGLKKDQDVLMLQKLLKSEGCFYAVPTGNFGAVTVAAVKCFQRKHVFTSIPSNGYVGIYTRRVLNNLYFPIVENKVVPAAPVQPLKISYPNVQDAEFFKGRSITISWTGGNPNDAYTLTLDNQGMRLKTLATVAAGNGFLTLTVPSDVSDGSYYFGLYRGDIALAYSPYIKISTQIIPSAFDIVIISDNYTNQQYFQEDFSRLKDFLFRFEPFKLRAFEIAVHGVWNTESLGCYRTYGGNSPDWRNISCDNSKAKQRVSALWGNSYDKIYILRDDYYGGSGGDVAVGYSGRRANPHSPGEEDLSGYAFVHEFGHSVGAPYGLRDEYVFTNDNIDPSTGWVGTGIEDGKIDRNCYHGNGQGRPTAVLWPGTDPAAYVLGCEYPNWWRSSEESVMHSYDPGKRDWFSPAAQYVLNQWIDYYTGKKTSDEVMKLIRR